MSNYNQQQYQENRDEWGLTPATIIWSQHYNPTHGSQYSQPQRGPYMSRAQLDAQLDPNNNAYVGLPSLPRLPSLPQVAINANDNQVQNLIRVRPRPGNPRQPQQYINTYGTCRSQEQPTFTEASFEWAVYGIDIITDEYVCIFKCLRNKNKVAVVKSNLGISEATIKKCTMGARATFIKTIEDTCSDVIWFQKDKCPFAPSIAEQSIEDIIASALATNLAPEKFRLKHPKIASVGNNLKWYKNCYDAQQEAKTKTDQKDAVEWFQTKINPIQTAVVNLMETTRDEYCREYNSEAKRVLMGHRKALVVVSPDGGRGLSTAGKYMKFKHGPEKVICISGGGKSDDLITNFHSQLEKATNCQFLVWNVPRASCQHWSWPTLEQICDAMTSTNKYKAITMMVAPPTPAIITNKMFALRNEATKQPLITLDRIEMYRVMSTEDTIQPVDVYEYYIAKYGEDPRLLLNNRQEIDLGDL